MKWWWLEKKGRPPLLTRKSIWFFNFSPFEQWTVALRLHDLHLGRCWQSTPAICMGGNVQGKWLLTAISSTVLWRHLGSLFTSFVYTTNRAELPRICFDTALNFTFHQFSTYFIAICRGKEEFFIRAAIGFVFFDKTLLLLLRLAHT